MTYIQMIQYSCGHTLETPSQTPTNGIKVVKTLCRECRLKAKEDAPTQKSLLAMCPSFKNGSEKQIEYAGKNREKFIRYWINRASDTQILTVKEIITKEDSAKWWMDNYTLLQTEEFIATYIHTPQKKKTKAPVPPPPKDTMYLKEALIKPAELGVNGFIDNPMYIHISDSTVIIVPAKENSELTDILNRYTPRDGAFVRETDEFSGKATDRAAESALKLLSLGYPVIIHNQEVRNKVFTKTFKKEATRWLRSIDDNYAMIKWEGYDKNLCTKALTLIPGARWKDKYHIVVVPIKNNEQYLLRFASDNGLSVQAKLREQLQNA